MRRSNAAGSIKRVRGAAGGEGKRRSAASYVPPTRSLRQLAAAAGACQGCDLYKAATQVVFGAGPRTARVMLVGEQPGDQEDQQGTPFVGPAGALLDRALEDAGISRREVYVTNTVKHFKWEPRGKRRIHKKPRMSEVNACRPWLDAELNLVRPSVVVCLGATAAQAILGPRFKLMEGRGRVETHGPAPRVVATLHPSAILRAPDAEARRSTYEMLVRDLRVVANLLDDEGTAGSSD